MEKGETQGFMKIIVSAETKRIIGAAILGTGGDEVIHCILDVMYAGVPFTVLQRHMHIHPTVSELLPRCWRVGNRWTRETEAAARGPLPRREPVQMMRRASRRL